MNANRKMDMDINLTSGRVDLNTLEPPPSVAVIRRIGDGFKAFQVLRAGYKSGLFDGWSATDQQRNQQLLPR